MKRNLRLVLMISLPVIGLVAGYIMMARNVQATVDGAALSIRTRALTVGGALRSAGYALLQKPGFQRLTRSNLTAPGWYAYTAYRGNNRSKLSPPR